VADPRLAAVYGGRAIGIGAFVKRRWTHGRCFGAMRAVREGAGRRAARLLAAPIVSPLVLARLARRVLARRGLPSAFPPSFPQCALAVLLWWAGETTGQLLGAGGSCEAL